VPRPNPVEGKRPVKKPEKLDRFLTAKSFATNRTAAFYRGRRAVFAFRDVDGICANSKIRTKFRLLNRVVDRRRFEASSERRVVERIHHLSSRITRNQTGKKTRP
jgi:hypothetical protein